MIPNEILKITGFLNIKVFDENQLLKDERNIKNLVVTTGKNYIASRMIGVSEAVMSHMALGSGTDATIIGDTALQTEFVRIDAPDFTTSITSPLNVVQYVGTFGPGVGTGSITEAGIFNAMAMGTMLARTVFPVVNKAAGDTVVITWNITVS